jgi:hypothetical protein
LYLFILVPPDSLEMETSKIPLVFLVFFPQVGGYDDGNGAGSTGADAGSGTGATPYKLITYADRLYLEAELISAGVITGDAKAVFKKAMEASMSQVDYIIQLLYNRRKQFLR